MTVFSELGKVLVVAPHPDDEVLGCGGSLARFAKLGIEVHVLVATQGQPPLFSKEDIEQVRNEMLAAHTVLGVTRTHHLNLPAAQLGTKEVAEVNAQIGEAIEAISPDTIFLPFVGDIHVDHKIVFDAAMVAVRPRHDKAPRTVLCYETLSETNWYAPPSTPAFMPNVFIDIAETLATKIEAFREFESQVRAFPEERSIEAIEALARTRGATNHLFAAEAFMNIRQILR